jgi:AcrR family transcriptional regulator
MAVPPQHGAPRRTRNVRPGGRSAKVKTAVLTSVLDELVEAGYVNLTYERVAARAGVHKATVYRRWPTKDQLVADALLAYAGQAVPMPDTGSVRQDLQTLAHAVIANITSPPGEELLRTLLSDAARITEITVAGRAFWNERFSLTAAIIRRGIDRGELPPDTDTDFLIEILIAPLYLRLLVTGQPLTTEYADRVVDWAIASTRAPTQPDPALALAYGGYPWPPASTSGTS